MVIYAPDCLAQGGFEFHMMETVVSHVYKPYILLSTDIELSITPLEEQVFSLPGHHLV